jgi:hypothetical protein
MHPSVRRFLLPIRDELSGFELELRNLMNSARAELAAPTLDRAQVAALITRLEQASGRAAAADFVYSELILDELADRLQRRLDKVVRPR